MQDQTFKALLVSRDENKKQSVDMVDMSVGDLMEGDTLVRVTHSTVNYKDGLALTGKGAIIRHWPLIPGIDLAGEVVETSHPDFKPGDGVILNGWRVGEAHHGAYAEMARVKGDWLVHRPDGFSAADTMAIGTAGYTAMLCVLALEKHDITPDRGAVVVTGNMTLQGTHDFAKIVYDDDILNALRREIGMYRSSRGYTRPTSQRK